MCVSEMYASVECIYQYPHTPIHTHSYTHTLLYTHSRTLPLPHTLPDIHIPFPPKHTQVAAALRQGDLTNLTTFGGGWGFSSGMVSDGSRPGSPTRSRIHRRHTHSNVQHNSQHGGAHGQHHHHHHHHGVRKGGVGQQPRRRRARRGSMDMAGTSRGVGGGGGTGMMAAPPLTTATAGVLLHVCVSLAHSCICFPVYGCDDTACFTSSPTHTMCSMTPPSYSTTHPRSHGRHHVHTIAHATHHIHTPYTHTLYTHRGTPRHPQTSSQWLRPALCVGR